MSVSVSRFRTPPPPSPESVPAGVGSSFRFPDISPWQNRLLLFDIENRFPLTEHPAQPDNTPENDEFINVDIRVMGSSVLVGYIQIL